MDYPQLIPIDIPSGNVPIPSRTDRADLIDKIKPEPVIELIRNMLMGKEKIKGQWIDVPALKNWKLTDVGAWEITNLIQGVAHIGVTISKFKDVEIKKRAFAIANTAQIMLVQNWIAYGLKNTAQMYFIHQILFTTILALLKQADEASIQDLLGKVVQESRTINMDRKEPSQSKIKRMMGMQ